MGDSSTAAATATLIATPTALITSVIAAVIIGCILSLWRAAKPIVRGNTLCCHGDDVLMPFVVLQDPKWKDIGRSMARYEQEVEAIMNGLSRSLEIARTTEWDLFGEDPPDWLLSDLLQRRINRLATLFEQNTKLLQEELFKPFPVIKVLPATEPSHEEESWWTARPPPNQPPHRATTIPEESSSYDSATQVMAHITRDWTTLGQSARQRTYDWCRYQLTGLSRGSSILVPGAGLGRLAYDLACDGHSVEANDSSLLMSSAAYAILRRKVRGMLHPFLMDFFTNEVDSEQRYDAVRFPDAAMHDEMKGNLSYTIGDFAETYSTSHYKDGYDGIVTCFFLDTATNIYEYLLTIQNVLRKGGVWVHVGPLQWHRNALLHPSADELKGLVESMGFQIRRWSIDLEAMDYRSEEYTTVRSTKYEAFRPVRMVAVRRNVTKTSLSPRLFLKQQRRKNYLAASSRHIPSEVVVEEL